MNSVIARRVVTSALVAALLPLAAPRHLAAQGPKLPPFLELRIPKAPTVGTGDGGSFLVYELHVTNFATLATTLTRVEVATGGADRRVLLTLSDSALSANLSRPGTAIPVADRATIAGGARAVVWLWVPVDRANPPASVVTRVVVQTGSGETATTGELDAPAASVTREAVNIGAPLRGGTWLAGNGPENATGHRRALIPIGGTPSIAQRFAIDWVLLGDDDKTFTGDALDNANYHAYGKDALAVADGIVVETKDSIPQNVPGENSRAVPITLETVGGNHVVIDIGGGRRAFYAHLQPGSLKVKLGDHVKKGQVIGLVGNSGNSTEPHLHFHISDGVSPLGSEGLPYGLDSFDLVGRCANFNTGCSRNAGVTRKGEVPLANMLVKFP